MRKVFAGMLRFLSSMFALGVRARCVFGFLNVHQWRFDLRMDEKPIKCKHVFKKKYRILRVKLVWYKVRLMKTFFVEELIMVKLKI